MTPEHLVIIIIIIIIIYPDALMVPDRTTYENTLQLQRLAMGLGNRGGDSKSKLTKSLEKNWIMIRKIRRFQIWNGKYVV